MTVPPARVAPPLGTSGNISLSEAGQTRDLAAAKAGLGSGKTLEAAQKVVEHGTPELVAMPQTWVMAQICVIRQGYPKAGDPARLEHLILKLRMDYRDSGSCLARRRPVGRRHDDLKALEGIGTMRDVFTTGGGLGQTWNRGKS